MAARGAFITLEGTEGVGKSTLRDRLREQLSQRGYSLVVTREPGGTPLGERIREWLLDADHAQVSAEVEALLMFAARDYHLDNLIRPALSGGRWVLCDRFTDATYAYQGGGRGLSLKLLDTLKAAVHKDVEPDLTLLLDAPIELGFSRITHRTKDHFEREDAAFFERARETYLRLAADHPERIRVVDATLSPDRVWERASREVTAFIDRFEKIAAARGRHG